MRLRFTNRGRGVCLDASRIYAVPHIIIVPRSRCFGPDFCQTLLQHPYSPIGLCKKLPMLRTESFGSRFHTIQICTG